MKELNSSQLNQVSGGGVAAVIWVVRGGVYLYRKYKTVEKVTDAAAAAYVVDKLTD